MQNSQPEFLRSLKHKPWEKKNNQHFPWASCGWYVTHTNPYPKHRSELDTLKETRSDIVLMSRCLPQWNIHPHLMVRKQASHNCTMNKTCTEHSCLKKTNPNQNTPLTLGQKNPSNSMAVTFSVMAGNAASNKGEGQLPTTSPKRDLGSKPSAHLDFRDKGGRIP